MLESLFDLPLILSGLLIVGSLCLFAIGGLLLVRRYVLPRLHVSHEDAHFSGAMVHSIMVFYGLALALIAVNVFETYADVSKIISQEATALAALYRDMSAYPEPVRSQLQKELRDYVDYTIHEAWPVQQRGQVPTAGIERINRFQEMLVTFEPATERQKILHAEAFRAYNTMIQARRMRLDAVNTGLPGVMWTVVVMGAVISVGASFLFRVDDVRLHVMLVTLLAMFIGMVIFMTLALDRPFRGELGVRADPYQLIYDHLMKP
jgi:hypothetical protein